jgi:hypothetical protein
MKYPLKCFFMEVGQVYMIPINLMFLKLIKLNKLIINIKFVNI